MKKYGHWYIFCISALLALSLQGCSLFGGSGNSNFKTTNTGSNNHQIGVNQNQDIFKGKFYFTIDHNLWVLDGNRNLTQLTQGMEVHDPAVSPDGKSVAFVVRYKNYADLAYMAATGGPVHIILTGNGKFYHDSLDPTIIKNSYHWLAQPGWSADGSSLYFLSDFQKEDWYSLGGLFAQSPFLDLQVFSVKVDNPDATAWQSAAQVVAYASFGDGGDRDPSYRPGHPDQLIYTHYRYDDTGTKQVIQLFMEDPTAIANHPNMYTPLFDPAVAITPTSTENIQPAFSPDGNSIAYVRRDDATQKLGIYVMSVPENITQNPNDPTVVKNALIPYNSSSLIVSDQYVSQPVWSPDGKQLAYLSYANSTFDIWLASVSLDSQKKVYSMQGSPIQLTSGGIDGDSRPFWTP